MMQRNSRTTFRRAAMLVAVCCAVSLLWPRGALAQLAPVFSSPADDEPLLSDIFLTPRYETRRRLIQAKSLLEQRRYGEAVTQLDRLLTQGEDYFLLGAGRRVKEGHSPPRLKSEALRLIGQMPPKGLEWYELQYGAAARAMLDQAKKQSDLRALHNVAGRYFHTVAGYEATSLLARRHLDRGRPLAAAMCYQKLIASPARARYEPALSVSLAAALLRAGHHDRLALNALHDVKKNFSDAQLEIAGQQIPWFAADEDALAWLRETLGPQQPRGGQVARQWNLFGGNPARNGASRGGAPLRSWRWKVPVSSSPVVTERVEKLQRAYAARGYIALPSFHPLAVGDTILMRTASHFVAVDLKTGKRLWPKQPALDIAAGESADDDSPGARFPGARFSGSRRATTQFMHNLDRRMWSDAIYGRLASDGRLLFAVRKIAPLGDRKTSQIGINAAGRRIILPAGPRTYNQLDAYELATEGKLKWSVGGPPVGDGKNDKNPLAGAFFLGVPLPLDGRLYALAEMSAKREIRLVVLEAETGRLLWSQQLAMAEWSVLRDPIRRAAGASPSYSNGLLICPTTAGAVVAVDLSTRRLKWGYRYPRNPRSQYANVGRVNALEQGSSGDDVGDGWADSSAVLADGYVLVTPPDNYSSGARSGEIHCLNLIDGKRIWKRKRNRALYLACVSDGKVILVGRGAVTALSIIDGTPHKDWPTVDNPSPKPDLPGAVALPAGALASGRGFLSDGHYFLPLTTGEIVKIDLSNGKIVERIRLRDGLVPGNLICYRDQIVSQGADALTVFHQLDPSRRWIEKTLKDRPNDPAALLLRGRIHLDEGRAGEAVTDLRASLAGAVDDEEARQLLVEAMLARLTGDFDRGTPPPQKFIDRLQSLVETPEERVALLRRLAGGLAKTGKRTEAFATLMKLVDLDESDGQISAEPLERIEPSLDVRRSRWVRAALGQLRADANLDEKKALEQAVADRRPKTDDVEKLKQFIEHFAAFDATDDVRRRLVARLAGPATMAQREHLLRRLERSADAAQRRAAVADMAALLVEARRADEAAGYYARLKSDPELADVVCRDGKTGRELARALAKDSPVRRYLGRSGVWPRGGVTHDAKRPNGLPKPSMATSYRVKLRGDGGPFFTETTAHLDPDGRAFSGATLSGRDAYGIERWRISFSAESRRSRYGYPMAAAASYCAARGHLLLFSSGNNIYAIDTLHAAARGSAQSDSEEGDSEDTEKLSSAVLWHHERNEQIPGVAVGQGYRAGLSYGRYYGQARRDVPPLGPVTDGGVCFQRARELICVDLLTGQIQWARRGLPEKCELFGDDDLLLVVPPNSKQAQVFRAADGKLLGERDLPSQRRWITTVGRYLLTKTINDDDEMVIAMLDPWNEKKPQRWPPLKFAADSQLTLVDHDALAVLEPNGHFTIHALDDRRTLVDTQLKAEAASEAIEAIYVLPSRDRYLLVVDRPVQRKVRKVRVSAAPSGNSTNMKLVNARMYAFDRASGKQQWPAPARIDQYGLLLHQPRELPVFVVARQLRFSGKSTRSELLCLDKRSGRLVYRSPPLPAPINNYTITGDPAQRVVWLNILRGKEIATSRLVFGDGPISPDPPYQGNQSGGPSTKPAGKFKGAGDDPFSDEAGSDDQFPDEEPDDDD